MEFPSEASCQRSKIPLAPLVASRESRDAFCSSKLGICGAGSGRGVVALEPVQRDELLLRVPASHCLIGYDWSDLVESLASELEAPSRLPAAYVDLLPQVHEVDPPFAWPEEHLQTFFDGTAFLNEVLDLQAEVRSRSGGNHSHQCLRAEVCLRSRSYKDVLDSRSCWVVLPWIDLFNYDPGMPCASPRACENGFELRAAIAASPGDEIFADYHQKSTRELVLSYGYAPACSNPYASKIKLPLAKLDGLRGRLQRQLKLHAAEVTAAEPVAPALVAWHNLSTIKEADLKRILQMGDEKQLLQPSADAVAAISSMAKERLARLKHVQQMQTNCEHKSIVSEADPQVQRRSALAAVIISEEVAALQALCSATDASAVKGSQASNEKASASSDLGGA